MSELEIMALFTPTEDHVHSVEDLLKAAVAPSRAEPGNVAYTVREGGNRLCFVRDPDGYRIEIIERG